MICFLHTTKWPFVYKFFDIIFVLISMPKGNTFLFILMSESHNTILQNPNHRKLGQDACVRVAPQWHARHQEASISRTAFVYCSRDWLTSRRPQTPIMSSNWSVTVINSLPDPPFPPSHDTLPGDPETNKWETRSENVLGINFWTGPQG